MVAKGVGNTGRGKYKPVVHYIPDVLDVIRVGTSALITPINHYGYLVSNTKLVKTSKVLNYNPETGIFETENTIYIPKPPVGEA